jgi:hypothetical protein
MSGDCHPERSCPSCDGSLSSISDCFTGQAKHIDNFDEIEDYLREKGVVSDDDPFLTEHTDKELAEARESLAESDNVDDVFNRDGPFITDMIVCTETWCDDCSFSERTYTPPEAVAEQLAATITE